MKKINQISLTTLLMIILFSIFGCEKSAMDEIMSHPETQREITGIRTLKVNVFGGTNPCTDIGWNNWNTNQSLSNKAFLFTDGTASSITATLSGQMGISDNGDTFNTTYAPKSVTRYASYSSANRTLTFAGLDNAKLYSIELYAARTGSTNNTTQFTIGSAVRNIVTDNNTSTTAIFNDIAPNNGSIIIGINKLYNYNYFNGFTIKEQSYGTAPLPTTNGRSYILTPNNSGEIYIADASTQPWKGGDTLLIPAGNYSLIHFGNLKGLPGAPIVIRNLNGQVISRQFRLVDDAAHIVFDGSGAAGIAYGFKASSNANAGLAINLAHHVEIKHVEITGTEVGIYYKANPTTTNPLSIYPNYVLTNVYIHHNYIHDVHGEGMYIGHTYPGSDPYNNNLTPIRMDKVEIAYNIVDGTDWDGIQLSNARSQASIHHNTVSNFGRINMGSQQSGIILGGNTNGTIQHNEVKNGTGNGIQVFGYGTILLNSNSITNVGNDGTTNGQESIFCNDPINTIESNPKQQIRITNNIIRNPKPRGAIRIGAYLNNSLPSEITYNTIYLSGAAANWATYHLITNVAGSTISNNTLNP